MLKPVGKGWQIHLPNYSFFPGSSIATPQQKQYTLEYIYYLNNTKLYYHRKQKHSWPGRGSRRRARERITGTGLQLYFQHPQTLQHNSLRTPQRQNESSGLEQHPLYGPPIPPTRPTWKSLKTLLAIRPGSIIAGMCQLFAGWYMANGPGMGTKKK